MSNAAQVGGWQRVTRRESLGKTEALPGGGERSLGQKTAPFPARRECASAAKKQPAATAVVKTSYFAEQAGEEPVERNAR
jgi:hypothetical protein